jgi:hypothetical protein
MLSAHLDVVPAEKESWASDPFGADEREDVHGTMCLFRISHVCAGVPFGQRACSCYFSCVAFMSSDKKSGDDERLVSAFVRSPVPPLSPHNVPDAKEFGIHACCRTWLGAR